MKNGQPPTPAALNYPAMDDALLVRRFANCRDEAAFAELVRRYRGLVYGVARRVLSHRQDAEDVFQAAFLVLARDAADIRNRASVASWLYGVAHRIALRARAKRAAQHAAPLKDDTMDHANPFAEVAQRSELQSLDEELNALPERVREPLVLRYLLGRSNGEIAEELGLTESAVESRLKRGRERLRKQLARRGVGLIAVIAVLEASRPAVEAAVADSLVTGTIQAGLSFTSAGTTHPLYSQAAANLAAKEVSTMTTTSFGTIGTLALATTVVVALAIGLSGPANFVAGNTENVTLLHNAGGKKKSPARSNDVPIRVAKGKLPAKVAAANLPLAKESFDYADVSKAEKALEQDAKLTIIDQTLPDALKIIEDKHKIQIIQLTKVLTNEAVNTGKLINHTLSGVKLRSALNIILAEFEPPLTYVLEDEVLKITTVTNAEDRMQTRLYETRHLKSIDPFLLAEIIQKTVNGPWRDGPEGGGIGGTAKPVPGGLVVQQNYQAHLRVQKFLKQLARQPELSNEEIKRFDTQAKENRKVEAQREQAARDKRIEAVLRRVEGLLMKQPAGKKVPGGKAGGVGGGTGGGFF